MYDIMHMPGAIKIGYVGENLFRPVEIDMTGWLEQMPDGVPSIVHIRPYETPADAYIAATTFEDGILRWDVTSADLGPVEGAGTMQVWMEEQENNSLMKRGKSALVTTQIHLAINDASETPPEPQEAWMEQMTALKVATVTAAQDAETARGAAETAKDAAVSSAAQASGSASTAATASTAAVSAKTASEAARDAAQAAALHYPYVDPVTGDWMVWSTAQNAFVDTGVHAQGVTGTVPDIEVGTVTTVDNDVPARVERRSGTPDEAPVFDFWLPKGATGVPANMYATTIPMSSTDDTKIYDAMGGKVDKETGKGLSKNDFTDALKAKLDGIDEGATANTVSDSLDDTSTTNALSAAKGKELAESKVNISGTYLVEKIGESAHAIYSAGDYMYTDQGLYVAAVDIAPGTIISIAQLNPVHPKGAVNKLVSDIQNINDDIGSTPMGTTATTLTGAIAEHESDISEMTGNISGLQDGLAILADGDTHAAIASGQFVYVKNHGTLAEGLYKATTAIGANAALSTSNLTADGAGGLNDLQGQVASLNSKLTTKNSYETEFDVSVVSTGCHFYCDRIGKTIFVDIVFQATSSVAINTQIAHINGISNILETHASAIGSNGTGARFLLLPNGNLKIERAIPANEWFSTSFVALYNTGI